MQGLGIPLKTDQPSRSSSAIFSRFVTLACTALANLFCFPPMILSFAAQRRRALESDLDELSTARRQLKEREAALSSKADSLEVSERWVELFFYPARANATCLSPMALDVGAR